MVNSKNIRDKYKTYEWTIDTTFIRIERGLGWNGMLERSGSRGTGCGVLILWVDLIPIPAQRSLADRHRRTIVAS